MQKYNKIAFIVKISPSSSQSSRWMGLLNSFRPLAMLLFLIPGFGCNSKPKETIVSPPYFTINGTELKVDVVGIPNSLNNDVYQAVVDTSINFKGPMAVSPEMNQWIIDGKVIESGKDHFTYTFELPGLYQVKHCHGTDNCATRFVYVKEPVVIQEAPVYIQEIQSPIQKEKTSPRNQIINEDRRRIATSPKPKDPASKPSTPSEQLNPSGPSTTQGKRTSKPPAVYKSSMITGLPSSNYKSDCASWVETASIKLAVKDWCELHSASVYGNSAGQIRITLSDGKNYNESMIVTLNPGKTNFSFAGLDAELQPGAEYTLKISTLSDKKSEKPKIGNISNCGPGSGNASSVISIDYGSDTVLFDLKYKY